MGRTEEFHTIKDSLLQMARHPERVSEADLQTHDRLARLMRTCLPLKPAATRGSQPVWRKWARVRSKLASLKRANSSGAHPANLRSLRLAVTQAWKLARNQQRSERIIPPRRPPWVPPPPTQGTLAPLPVNRGFLPVPGSRNASARRDRLAPTPPFSFSTRGASCTSLSKPTVPPHSSSAVNTCALGSSGCGPNSSGAPQPYQRVTPLKPGRTDTVGSGGPTHCAPSELVPSRSGLLSWYTRPPLGRTPSSLSGPMHVGSRAGPRT